MLPPFLKAATGGLLVAMTLAGCSPADLLHATVPTRGLTVTRDVPYGRAPRQSLDIYRPSAGSDLPVVVFYYGGSWNSGEKATYLFVAATLARRGNVVVVPDYRLYPQVAYPVFLQDNALAAAWTISHLGELGGAGDRVFLMGHSAGAYNAAMLATDGQWLRGAGTCREAFAGMIGLAGPYDFLPITDPEVKAVFAPASDKAVTQPVNHVDGKNPPLLLLAGSADETVYPRNTRSLAVHAREAGGMATEKIYPGLGHIGLITAIAPVFQWRAPVLDDVQDFIDRTRARDAIPAAACRSAG